MNYLAEDELYNYWYLSQDNEGKISPASLLYNKKEENLDSFSGELFIYQIKEIFEEFKIDYSINLSLFALKREKEEITKTTNYYGLGKELWERLKKKEKVSFDDLLKIDYEKIDFSRPTFISAITISYSKEMKKKAKTFLKKYLIKFIRDELDADPISFLEDRNRYIGSFHSFRDFGLYIKKQEGKFLPKNIKITKEGIAEVAIEEEIFSDTNTVSSNEYDESVKDYMSGYRFLETILSSELVGFIKVKHIGRDGTVYADKIDKQIGNENYNEIRKKKNKEILQKKEDIQNETTKIKNSVYSKDGMGYFLIEDKNIEIGSEKNVPFKLLKSLVPIGTSKDVDDVFYNSSKNEKIKNDKHSTLQKVDILKNRMKELQEVLRKNKIKIKMGHNEIAKKVFLDWVRG